MIKKILTGAVKKQRLRWQRHALERMMERGISRSDVKQVLLNGEIIEEYSDDHPFPSGLFLGFINGAPLHVVAAIDKENEYCYIITSYRPDLTNFKSDYKTRKK
jgi:hypothetical protein